MLIDLAKKSVNSIIDLKYLIVLLYDYCICYSYMYKNNFKTVENISATLTCLKEFCSSLDTTECVNEVCKRFLATRNGFSHLTEKLFDLSDLQLLLRIDLFYKILQLCDVPVDVILSLREHADNSLNNTFSSHNYLCGILGDKVTLLAEASINACESIDDCNELLDSISHLL